jgi:hypothetical protein
MFPLTENQRVSTGNQKNHSEKILNLTMDSMRVTKVDSMRVKKVRKLCEAAD